MSTDIISVMKAATWEEAKGKLRALVALSGSDSSTADRRPRFEDVGRVVEGFITEFENEGLQE
jgi:hypothetical protein